MTQSLPPLPMSRPRPRFQRTPATTALAVVVPLLAALFVLILVLQQSRLERLEEQLANTTAALAQEQDRTTFYKRAYETTLEDMLVLSTAYGGPKERYAGLAQDLRARELESVLGDINATNVTLRNPGLWSQYVRNGIVNTSCLPPPVAMDTLAPQVLLTLETAGNGTYDVYMAGSLLSRGEAGRPLHLLVSLPSGEYEVDVVHATPLILTNVWLDTQPLPVSQFVADAGSGWQVFDCQETGSSSTGALRARFLKH